MLLITCFIFGLLGSLTWAGPHHRTVCPFDTFAYKDGSEWNCYKFYEEQLTFEEAEEDCQRKWKGHLASFKSDKQTKYVGTYVTKENIAGIFVWIGLQRDENSSMNTGWRWTDGSRSKYRKWHAGEPNNYKELCVGLAPRSAHLTWGDLNCTLKYPYLCKWKPS